MSWVKFFQIQNFLNLLRVIKKKSEGFAVIHLIVRNIAHGCLKDVSKTCLMGRLGGFRQSF